MHQTYPGATELLTSRKKEVHLFSFRTSTPHPPTPSPLTEKGRKPAAESKKAIVSVYEITTKSTLFLNDVRSSELTVPLSGETHGRRNDRKALRQEAKTMSFFPIRLDTTNGHFKRLHRLPSPPPPHLLFMGPPSGGLS
jgi:hypothetical protein